MLGYDLGEECGSCMIISCSDMAPLSKGEKNFDSAHHKTTSSSMYGHYPADVS